MAASGGGVAAGAATVAAGLGTSAAAEGAAASEGTGGAADPGAADGNTARAVPARGRAGPAPVTAPAAEPPPLNLARRAGTPGAAGSSAGSVIAGASTAPRASATATPGAATAVPPPVPGGWPAGRPAAHSGPVTARQLAGAPPRQPSRPPASRPAGPGGRLRVQQPAPAAGRRLQADDGRRQHPTLRGQSATGRAESAKPADGQPVPWQGQAMTAPLARRADEPERPVPFWLRPVRRR